MLRYSAFVMLQAMATVAVLLTGPVGVSWI
jgi:hypothetical protein